MSRPGEPPIQLDARMLRTRTALCGALLELLKEKPFDQITVREITRTADVGYATFFRHYPDKEALLHELAADEVHELLARAVPILSATGTRASTLALCAYVAERRKLWSALLTGGAAGALREEFLNQAKQIAARHPDPDSWVPRDLHVIHATGGTLDVLSWWLRGGEDHSVEQVAEILDRLVVSPTMGT